MNCRQDQTKRFILIFNTDHEVEAVIIPNVLYHRQHPSEQRCLLRAIFNYAHLPHRPYARIFSIAPSFQSRALYVLLTISLTEQLAQYAHTHVSPSVLESEREDR
jgi:hypothetical protein